MGGRGGTGQAGVDQFARKGVQGALGRMVANVAVEWVCWVPSHRSKRVP